MRTLQKGASSCRCPSTLVAYSRESTSLPVVFVGVDSSLQRAYWTPVSDAMPGYNKEHQTFTIHFTEALDAIDRTESCPCYHRWLELSTEYRVRIQQYPVLARDANQGWAPGSLSASEWDALQRFVDTLNRLLDDDFNVVKKLLFPGVWKFGVGCRIIDEIHVLYQLSSIPKGEPGAPVIFELPSSVTLNSLGRNVQTSVAMGRERFFGDPVQCAREYVLGFVGDLWRARAFPVQGPDMAADVVLGFVDRYRRWLELPSDQDEYQIEELSRAFGPVLSRTTGAVAARMPLTPSGVQTVDLDAMTGELATAIKAGPGLGHMPGTYVVRSGVPALQAIASLRLLSSSSGVRTVRRLFRTPDLGYQAPPQNFIWSCYSRERELESVTALLSRAVPAYELFVRGNSFHVEASPYLDPTISIIFEYVCSHDNPIGPVLHEWHLRDPHRALEKATVISSSTERPDLRTAVVNGESFEVERAMSRLADFFFRPCPLSNLLYRFLSDDLGRDYQMSLISPY